MSALCACFGYKSSAKFDSILNVGLCVAEACVALIIANTEFAAGFAKIECCVAVEDPEPPMTYSVDDFVALLS